MNNNIKKLNAAGQSIWYDNLSKDILASGSLAKLIAEGISGLTSNPAIFEQAIAKTETYLADIAVLKKKGFTAPIICDELMVRDVANAADLLLPNYKESSGRDGYASLEVSPLLANNTEETVNAAIAFWEKLARPNIMIKVPATPAGIPAIRELIVQGINVNVTLIFSPQIYQEVINSYVHGLKIRIAQGQDITGIHSVASFFISRADTWFENKIGGNQKLQQLVGKVGIANGLKAYQVFRENFEGHDFQSIQAEASANIQRILWASTGVKNKALPGLLYATGLPYANSVATHPPALIEDILQATTLDTKISELDYPQILETLEQENISISEMYEDLLTEGVEKFAQAYHQLIKAIETAK